ncbi:MAG: hypothetical protein WHT46_08550, partial [Candidatus Geothermincolales bacterium]
KGGKAGRQVGAQGLRRQGTGTGTGPEIAQGLPFPAFDLGALTSKPGKAAGGRSEGACGDREAAGSARWPDPAGLRLGREAGKPETGIAEIRRTGMSFGVVSPPFLCYRL